MVMWFFLLVGSRTDSFWRLVSVFVFIGLGVVGLAYGVVISGSFRVFWFYGFSGGSGLVVVELLLGGG